MSSVTRPLSINMDKQLIESRLFVRYSNKGSENIMLFPVFFFVIKLGHFIVS